MTTTPARPLEPPTLKDRAPEIAAAIEKFGQAARYNPVFEAAYSAYDDLEALILAALPSPMPPVNQEALEAAYRAHYSFTGGEYNLVEAICRAYHKALPPAEAIRACQPKAETTR